jgi:trehalose 6-phosphate synthase
VLFRMARSLKYVALGFGLIAVLALAIAPFSKRLIEQWSRSDVEARSRLVYNAIQNPLVRAIADKDAARISIIFENVALDARILAVGLCDEAGKLQSPTKDADDVFLRQGCAIGGGEFFHHYQ